MSYLNRKQQMHESWRKRELLGRQQAIDLTSHQNQVARWEQEAADREERQFKAAKIRRQLRCAAKGWDVEGLAVRRAIYSRDGNHQFIATHAESEIEGVAYGRFAEGDALDDLIKKLPDVDL
jgi:hypothetical protein